VQEFKDFRNFALRSSEAQPSKKSSITFEPFQLILANIFPVSASKISNTVSSGIRVSFVGLGFISRLVIALDLLGALCVWRQVRCSFASARARTVHHMFQIHHALA
jgi:hypothetical protein